MEIVAEEWRSIEGFVGYEASSLGRVRSVPRLVACSGGKVARHKGRVLSQYADRKGYLGVSVGANRVMKVHRLVAIAFHGESDLHINHKDGNKTNNSPENLEYVTPKQNNEHARRTGLCRWCKGAANGRSKLRESEVIQIRQKRECGETLQSLSDTFGVSVPVVHDIVKRKTWKHVS